MPTGFPKNTSGVQPGEYILQIVVKDKIADKAVSQFIDFEVIQ